MWDMMIVFFLYHMRYFPKRHDSTLGILTFAPSQKSIQIETQRPNAETHLHVLTITRAPHLSYHKELAIFSHAYSPRKHN